MLSGDQQKRAVAWLNEKTSGNTTCEACGTNSLSVHPNLLHMSSTGGLVSFGADRGVSYIAIECTHCGYTRFFNATLAGVVSSS